MRWAFYGVALIAFDRSNLIWHARILPAHYPSPFICTGCAIRSLRHFKKNFLAFFIAVSPFSLSAAEIVQGDHAVAETAKSIAIGNTAQAKINASIALGENSSAKGGSIALGEGAKGNDGTGGLGIRPRCSSNRNNWGQSTR
ncbi:hypothetical protein [Acinetobacter terrae]|uniref:hypothetical protein n=1 Tax=Acinetobacter terrae TaxID=2731247 RepID=UPI0007D80A01|nr:hypothetical protein [Acinetobacter terrae]OAL85459.1 hypothetical protein AY608_03290 [Acinetobacter terrae]